MSGKVNAKEQAKTFGELNDEEMKKIKEVWKMKFGQQPNRGWNG